MQAVEYRVSPAMVEPCRPDAPTDPRGVRRGAVRCLYRFKVS
jgi:hypothetical protein